MKLTKRKGTEQSVLGRQRHIVGPQPIEEQIIIESHEALKRCTTLLEAIYGYLKFQPTRLRVASIQGGLY